MTSLADATKIGQFQFAVAFPKVIKGRNKSVTILGISPTNFANVTKAHGHKNKWKMVTENTFFENRILEF